MSEPHFYKQGTPGDGVDDKYRTGCRRRIAILHLFLIIKINAPLDYIIEIFHFVVLIVVCCHPKLLHVIDCSTSLQAKILWSNPLFRFDYDFVTVKTAKFELQIEQSRNRLTVNEVAFTYAYIQLPGFVCCLFGWMCG